MKVRSAAVMEKFTEPYVAGPNVAGHESRRLIGADEPPPFFAERRNGRSNFVMVIDHASPRIPRLLGDLGLPPSELQRHVTSDIGALAVARQVAEALDAPMVAQNYSRLVIDGNRDPRVATSIPAVSESTEIPGNLGLTQEQRLARQLLDIAERRKDPAARAAR